MDDTAASLFTCAGVLVTVVIVLEVLKRYFLLKEKTSSCSASNKDNQNSLLRQPLSELSICESRDCIRCLKNKDILMNAIERLTFYPNEYSENKNDDNDNASQYSNQSQTDEVKNICLDLKTSVESLKDANKTTNFNSEVSSPVVFKLRGIREQEVFSLDDFPAANILEINVGKIWLEFNHLYKSPLSETTCLWKRNTTAGGLWEIAMLIDQGRKTKAAELCPLTIQLIDLIPYAMKDNVFGNASFSIIHPGTEIARHSGSTNCRVRCHLGLEVPQKREECVMKVGSKQLHWEKGKLLFFNDAFQHSVNHDGLSDTGLRVVLMLDLWHPDVSESQRNILDFAFSS